MLSIDIFNPKDSFEEKALLLFAFQAEANPVYKSYLEHLRINPDSVQAIDQIPFLPIDFFKTSKVLSANLPISRVFKSSGTGNMRSKHFLVDLNLYEASFLQNFEQTYGSLDEICILALLPNYQENPDSSLLYMMNNLIDRTVQNGSEYLDLEDEFLLEKLKKAKASGLTTILMGVSFALLDLADKYTIDLSNIILMETGGMKGRRKELTREELHQILKERFKLQEVHSEYGMCELLSQAYSKANGIFHCPSWMKVYTRPILEPFGKSEFGQAGVLKLIDLANVYSCAFIETADLGRVFEDGSFEVLGRMDHAELRGCNLMYQ